MLVLAFLGAGIDTTVAALANTVQALIDFPDQWIALRAKPELTRQTFEEALRFTPPARYINRVARRDTVTGGALIRKGDGILMFFSAAGRDPARWTDPKRFDIARNTVGHLTFGRGIHNCVGQIMARMEAAALLAALVTQADTLEADGSPTRQLSNQLNTSANLPVLVTAAA
jgi:cytochrome P450